jgi:hypothetical protein
LTKRRGEEKRPRKCEGPPDGNRAALRWKAFGLILLKASPPHQTRHPLVNGALRSLLHNKRRSEMAFNPYDVPTSRRGGEGIRLEPAMNAACAFCGTSFAPQRSTARFCSSRCRTAAHRSSHVCNAVRAARATRGALKSAPGISATSRLSVTRNLGPRIVADDHWPAMYRLRLSDGALTDMTNLTRARDALANHAALNK